MKKYSLRRKGLCLFASVLMVSMMIPVNVTAYADTGSASKATTTQTTSSVTAAQSASSDSSSTASSAKTTTTKSSSTFAAAAQKSDSKATSSSASDTAAAASANSVQAGTASASKSVTVQEDTDFVAAQAVDALFASKIGKAFNKTYGLNLATADIDVVYNAYEALTPAQQKLTASATQSIVQYEAAVKKGNEEYGVPTDTGDGYTTVTTVDEMQFYGRYYDFGIASGFVLTTTITKTNGDTITVPYNIATLANNYLVAPGDHFNYTINVVNNATDAIAYKSMTMNLATMTYLNSGKTVGLDNNYVRDENGKVVYHNAGDTLGTDLMDYFYGTGTGLSHSTVDSLKNVDYAKTDQSILALTDSDSVNYKNTDAYLNDTLGNVDAGATSDDATLNLGVNFWTVGNAFQAVTFDGVLDVVFGVVHQTYGTNYSFVSGTAGMDLPSAIDSYLPAYESGIVDGTTVTAAVPSATVYAVNGGTWTFQSWDEASKTISGADINFVGIWVYTADPVTPVAPTDPTGPVTPTDPVTPVTPTDPVTPVTPTTPTTPTTPAPPSTTATVTPATPTAVTTITTTIVDDATPTAAAEEITEEATPLSAFDGGSWALLNLILTVLTGAVSVLLLAWYFVNKGYDEEEGTEYKQKRHGIARVLGIIPFIVAIIAFILTENMALPMIWIDQWTLLMAIIFAAELVVALVSQKRVKEEEAEKADQADASPAYV